MTAETLRALAARVERAEKAEASVAKLESALAQRPDDKNIALNLVSMRRFAQACRARAAMEDENA